VRRRMTAGLVAAAAANLVLTGALAVPLAPAAAAEPEVLALAAERGIPLPKARQTIDAQRRAAELVDPLRASLGPAFGGLWIGADDRVKIGVTGTAGIAARTAVHALTGSHGLDGLTDVVTVRHSAAALDAASEWLDARLERVDQGAEWPLQTAQSPSDNAVELRLPERGRLTAAQQRLVVEAKARFGSLLEISRYPGRVTADSASIQEICDIPRCDPPLRGGIRAVGGQVCTLAFVARGRGAGNTYVMSAGHCIGSSWSVTQNDGSQRRIGNVAAERFNRDGDAAIIHVENPGVWKPRPWVYVAHSRNTSWDPRYPIRADGRSVQGMRVCMTGAISATQCGVVLRTNVRVRYRGEDFRVRNLVETNYCSRGGDSGGPVYSGHTAYGIHTAGHRENGRCFGYYQPIRAAENFLNVDVVFDN
jgi:hypothetical protein